jgi:hypothetical protein
MTNKSLNDNYKNKELAIHNETDHEVPNEKFVIQKFEVSILVALVD